MRKPGLQALSIMLTVLLINIFIIPSRAYANIWNLPNGLSCTRSDNKLQFYISSQLICTSSDILLSDFNISLFPKNIQQLQAWQETYTKIPSVLPQPVCINQTINKKLPVYSGPTEKSFRAAKKKAVLSLREPLPPISNKVLF